MDSNSRLLAIWKPDLTDKMKRSFFQAAVMSMLQSRCTTWTLTKHMKKKLDGNHTKILQAVLNKSWGQHPTKQQLCGHLPLITKAINVRRTRHAGEVGTHSCDVIAWTPSHGRARAGRPARTYRQQFRADTGCSLEDLPEATHGGEKGSGLSVLMMVNTLHIYFILPSNSNQKHYQKILSNIEIKTHTLFKRQLEIKIKTKISIPT